MIHRKKDMVKIEILNADTETKLNLFFAEKQITAGFPSPADDYIENSLDLNKELIKHPASTFYGRIRGDSMIDAGINDGDIVVIDKSLPPKNGALAVCFIDGEFTLKKIALNNGKITLLPANNKYKSINISENKNSDFMVWGIVTYIIKKVF